MFKNIKYEFKKVISKNFIFLLLLLLIINGINIFVNYNQRKDKIYDQGYSVIYNKIKGTISNEKIEFISNGLSSTSKKVNNGNYNKKKKDNSTYSGYIYGDMSIYQEIYDELYNAVTYSKTLNSKLNILDENLRMSNDSNSKKIFKILKKRMSSRSISKYYNTTSMENFLNYQFSTLCIILLITVYTISLYTIDKNRKTYQIINITYKYKTKYIATKLISIFVMTLLLIIIFKSCDFIFFKYFNYLDGFLNPLYSLPYFNFTYSNMSILIYFIFTCLFKLLIIFSLELIIIFLSKLFFNALTLLFTSLCFIIIMLTNFTNLSSFPLSLIYPSILFKTGKLINIGGYIIDQYIILTLYMIIFILISIIIIFKFIERRCYIEKYST